VFQQRIPALEHLNSIGGAEGGQLEFPLALTRPAAIMLPESTYECETELPRRYHRPPAVKRRKPRRTGPSSPYEETTAPPDGGEPAEQPSDEFSDEEWEEDEQFEEEPAAVATTAEVPKPAARQGARHIQHDYSYVRTELMRVLVMGFGLLLALIVVSIFR
jgi:hypothetical protein